MGRPGKISLASAHPRIAAELHQNLNGDLTPALVSAGSSKRVWWRCRKDGDHVWATTVSNRTHLGNGCPMCSGRVATAATSLWTLRPEVARDWHPTRNKPLRPHDVRPSSHKNVWWKCAVSAAHEWQATVTSRSRGSGCPRCRGRYAGTLASEHPNIAAEWHPTRNESSAEGSSPRSNRVDDPRPALRLWVSENDFTRHQKNLISWATNLVTAGTRIDGASVDPQFAPVLGWEHWRRVLLEKDHPEGRFIGDLSFGPVDAKSAAGRAREMMSELNATLDLDG